MHEFSSALNAFSSLSRIPALPFFLALTGLSEKRVFNVLSSQLLLRAECGGSAACEVVNSIAVPGISQLSGAQGIREYSSFIRKHRDVHGPMIKCVPVLRIQFLLGFLLE